MYYVYVIKNGTNGDLYIGYTKNYEQRLKQHQRIFSKDKIIYYEAYTYEQDARQREQKLKHYSSAWRALKKRINA